MTLNPGNNPFALFTGLDGRPLNGGKVYIGVAGQDPETNPQPIFWDADGNVPAANPMETQAGYILNSGTPARFWTQDDTLSIRVRDKQGRQVFYEKNVSFALTAGEIPADPAEQKSIIEALALGLGDPETAALIGTADGSTVQEVVDAASLAIGGQASIQAKIEALRSPTNGRRAIAAPGSYTFNSALSVWGQFSNDGVIIDGAQSVIAPATPGVDGIDIGNRTGQIANAYYSNVALQNFSLVGNGKTDGASGVFQRVSAGNFLSNLRISNFQSGIYLLGGLSSNYHDIMVNGCGVGLRAVYHNGSDGLSAMGPNANSFYGLSLRSNDVAINYEYSPSTAINFFGGVWEANNYAAGTPTDGKTMFRFANAGHINIFGIHSESNKGQVGYSYSGFDDSKKFLMVGSDVIDNTGTLVHIDKGTFCSIANRISNSGSTHDLYLNTGAYATLIDTECRSVDGDVSHLASIRYGRIMLGGNPQASSSPFTILPSPIAGNANIAADFRNDTVQLRFLNTAGTRTGYIQFSTGNHALTNDNANGGWQFGAAGTARFYAGRLGAMTIEPGGDNTISCGSPQLRFNQVYAANATINTSDAREKQQIRELLEAERAVAVRLKGLVRAFKWNDAVAEKGPDGARWHFGVIAQDVIAAFDDEGLDAHDYGLLCYDEWEDQVESWDAEVETWGDEYETIPAKYSETETDEDGRPVLIEPERSVLVRAAGSRVIKEAGSRVIKEAGDRYGIRYEELLAFIIAAL